MTFIRFLLAYSYGHFLKSEKIDNIFFNIVDYATNLLFLVQRNSEHRLYPPIWASGTIAANNSNDASTTTDAQVTNALWQDTNPNGANYLDRRHALVGAHCMVNRLNTTVAVGQGTAHMEKLVDKDLTNGATFISGAKVESVTEPSYTIRDVKHTYKAGTTAGFVVTLDNSVLKLTVVDLPMRIFFYKNGKPISNVSCEQKQGSLLSLKLASFNTNTFEFTAEAPADFDEIGLGYSEGLTVKALGGMTVKYAFVGKNGKYYIDSEETNGIKDFKAAVKRNYPGTEFNNDELVLGQCSDDLQKTPDVTGNTIDNNPDDSDPLVIGAVLAIPTPITVSAYGGNETKNFPFKQGMTIGFETAGADVLDVGKFMQFRPYVMTYDAKEKKYSWTKQTVKNGEFTLLGLDLGGGRKDIITTLDQDCNAVELFAMSGLKLGASVVYRMFVELPPSIDDDDTLRVCRTSYL